MYVLHVQIKHRMGNFVMNHVIIALEMVLVILMEFVMIK